ncbi:MAG: hypothetical protein LBI45_05335 [Bacteroidales bacterium]|jgi:hypothetical protein|nr:hypothetical protein [Bacteroidales bacterium]
MKISKLEKGTVFTTVKGKSEYQYIGKFTSEDGVDYYLSTHAYSNGKSGFYTTKDIEVIDLPF